MRDTVLSWIEQAVHPVGFKRRDRVFTRKSSDSGITHVIALQMGKGSCAGLFRVNIGIFIPEAHKIRTGKRSPKHVDDFDCQIRLPLHALAGQSGWGFPLDEQPDVIRHLLHEQLTKFGVPFLQRLETRKAIVAEDWSKYPAAGFVLDNVSRAAILVELGKTNEAEMTLALEYENRSHAAPGSRDLVVKAAAELGLALNANLSAACRTLPQNK